MDLDMVSSSPPLDGVHGLVPRDRMIPAARSLRDTYARVPGIPLSAGNSATICLERWKEQGMPQDVPLDRVSSTTIRPATTSWGNWAGARRLSPLFRREDPGGPRRPRGGAGLRRAARALLQGAAQRLHAGVPGPPGQGPADVGGERQVAARSRRPPGAIADLEERMQTAATRAAARADDLPEPDRRLHVPAQPDRPGGAALHVLRRARADPRLHADLARLWPTRSSPGTRSTSPWTRSSSPRTSATTTDR